MSKYLILLLIALSAVVAVGLFKKKNMWVFIVIYWVVLTIKNIIDFVGW